MDMSDVIGREMEMSDVIGRDIVVGVALKIIKTGSNLFQDFLKLFWLCYKIGTVHELHNTFRREGGCP